MTQFEIDLFTKIEPHNCWQKFYINTTPAGSIEDTEEEAREAAKKAPLGPVYCRKCGSTTIRKLEYGRTHYEWCGIGHDWDWVEVHYWEPKYRCNDCESEDVNIDDGYE
jgi:hypothetical protein